MKKSAAIAMIFVYGLLSVGIQLHLHYCCGTLSEIAFFDFKKCCDDDQNKDCRLSQNCCRFEDVHFKIDSEHTISNFVYITACVPVPLKSYLLCSEEKTATLKAYNLPRNHAPPLRIPIYLSHRAMLFYA